MQFSAAKMQIEFLFGDRGRLAMDAYKANLKQTANQEVPKTFRKQELTEKSRLELEAGGTVKVSGLVDKKGKAYQGYITWKPGEKPAFMFPKDYKAALEEGRVSREQMLQNYDALIKILGQEGASERAAGKIVELLSQKYNRSLQ